MADKAKRTRRTRTKDWRPSFLKAFADSGNVKLAAETALIGRQTAYDERGRNTEFAASWEDAQEESIDGLEAEARRRGVEGWEEPVYYKGAVVGAIRKYSDTMLMALLNARGKKRGYTRDSRVQLSGEVAQKHTVVVTTDKRRTYGGKNGQRNGATETAPTETT